MATGPLPENLRHELEALRLKLSPEYTTPVLQTTKMVQRGVYRMRLKLDDQPLEGHFIGIDLSGLRKELGCEAMGLLGMDVLSHYSKIEIDFQEKVLLLRP